jgi:hypothetical protein
LVSCGTEAGSPKPADTLAQTGTRDGEQDPVALEVEAREADTTVDEDGAQGYVLPFLVAKA